MRCALLAALVVIVVTCLVLVCVSLGTAKRISPRDHYQTHGYVILPSIFARESVEQLGQFATENSYRASTRRTNQGVSDQGRKVLHVDKYLNAHPEIVRRLTEVILKDVLGLEGTHKLVGRAARLLVVSPGAKQQEVHFDGNQTAVESATSPHLINAIIALHDTPEEMGPTIFFSNEHTNAFKNVKRKQYGELSDEITIMNQENVKFGMNGIDYVFNGVALSESPRHRPSLEADVRIGDVEGYLDDAGYTPVSLTPEVRTEENMLALSGLHQTIARKIWIKTTRGWFFNSRPNPNYSALKRATRRTAMRMGEIAVFDRYTLHCAGHNRSGGMRLALHVTMSLHQVAPRSH